MPYPMISWVAASRFMGVNPAVDQRGQPRIAASEVMAFATAVAVVFRDDVAAVVRGGSRYAASEYLKLGCASNQVKTLYILCPISRTQLCWYLVLI